LFLNDIDIEGRIPRVVFGCGLSAVLLSCTDASRDLPVPDSTVLDVVSSSSGQQSATDPAIPSEQKLLTAITTEIIVPNYQNLKAVADAFVAPDGALAQHCALGLGALDNDSQFRNEFRDLVEAVQATEIHAVGSSDGKWRSAAQ